MAMRETVLENLDELYLRELSSSSLTEFSKLYNQYTKNYINCQCSVLPDGSEAARDFLINKDGCATCRTVVRMVSLTKATNSQRM